MTAHERHMSRCLELAALGEGWVSPNPLVGCVIVRNGEVVGEGFHRRFGGPHAEIAALGRAGSRAKGATLYVNLEPCAHHGKTPPCVDAIVAAGIRQVVIGHRDPNPLVDGRGIRRLRAQGVAVRVGTLEAEARALNEKFLLFVTGKRPFVALKIAQTLDGRIADVGGRSKWITSEQARLRSRRLRASYDAVLVGARTVLRDDPQLTVRFRGVRQPVRVVVDGRLTVPVNRRVFDTRSGSTIVVTSSAALRKNEGKALALERRGVMVIGLDGGNPLPWKKILRALAGFEIASVLVEGGSEVIGSLLAGGFGDRVYAFQAPAILGGGLGAFVFSSPLRLAKALRLHTDLVERVGGDVLVSGRIIRP